MPVKYEFREIGFGEIISSLLKSETLTDIEIRPDSLKRNGLPYTVWVVDIERGRSRLDLSVYSKEELDELTDFIFMGPKKLANPKGLNFSAGEPILDVEAVYSDRALIRMNAVNALLTDSEDVPLIAIRKFNYDFNITKEGLIRSGYCDGNFFRLMAVLLRADCNVMIAGKVGSGKTTLLKYLVRYIPDNESIITVEDTRETFLSHIYPDKEIGSLKSNRDNGFETLVKTCLRQNMDWLLVSEIRGRAVTDCLDAVSTSSRLISTVHANGVYDIPHRMVSMARADAVTSQHIYNQIFTDINIGIYINYYNDERGSHRQLTELCEYYTDENGEKKTHMLYWYDSAEKKYRTDFIRSAGILNKISRKGISMNAIRGIFTE